MENYNDLFEKIKSECDSPDAALSYLDACIKQKPDYFEAYLVRGELYLGIGEFEKALNDLNTAIKIAPSVAHSYHSRGNLYGMKGDVNKAFDDFNKAIECDANLLGAYVGRSSMYLRKKEFQKAIDDCTRAIEISQDESVEAYFNRGLAYVSMEEYAKALDDYDKVIELAPENAEAYGKRGYINSELGNDEEAISDIEEFLRLDPDNKNAQLAKDLLQELKSGASSSSYELEIAKKERKTLLICSAIGFFLGTIFGAAEGSVLMGMWFGTGVGAGISLIVFIPRLFMNVFREEGIKEAFKVAGIGSAVWFLLFMFAGPITLLVRVLKKNSEIKKLQGND